MVHGAGVGCRVQGAGCRVQGAWCRVQGAWCRVQGAGCRVQGAWCRIHLWGHDAPHEQAMPLRHAALDPKSQTITWQVAKVFRRHEADGSTVGEVWEDHLLYAPEENTYEESDESSGEAMLRKRMEELIKENAAIRSALAEEESL